MCIILRALFASCRGSHRFLRDTPWHEPCCQIRRVIWRVRGGSELEVKLAEDNSAVALPEQPALTLLRDVGQAGVPKANSEGTSS